jgi:hypothetical protein
VEAQRPISFAGPGRRGAPSDLPRDARRQDIDRRVYLYADDQIIAVQTDVLPPNVRGCWQHRCNALANMSIAPYPG